MFLGSQQFVEESPSRTRLRSLHQNLERANEETVRLSETLEEYKYTFEIRNSRIAMLEQQVQQVESERTILKQHLKNVSQTVIVKRDPLVSKIGISCSLFGAALLFSHYAGLISVGEAFGQFDGVVRQIFSIIPHM